LRFALDAGFNSLGPLNHTFKAKTGLTRSEYRRLAGVVPVAAPADFENGRRISVSAGQISNSA